MPVKLKRAVQKDCEEKQWRVNFYDNAVSTYAGAVNQLRGARGKMRRDQYLTLLTRSETARVAADAARLELEKHTQEHGC